MHEVQNFNNASEEEAQRQQDTEENITLEVVNVASNNAIENTTADASSATEAVPAEEQRAENDNAEHIAPMDIDVVNEEVVPAEEVNGAENEVPLPIPAEVEPFFGFEEELEESDEENDPDYDVKDLTEVLQLWETRHTQARFDPVPPLKRLANIFEKELEIYMRKDPDPFDERHPHRTDPSCQFGTMLKQLFRKEHFLNKLMHDYTRENFFTRQNLQKSSLELNILACRLILVIMPGLDMPAVFEGEIEQLLTRLYGWAEGSIEPLQSYAAGLLASAMDGTDLAVTYREQNSRLVPKLIKRLHLMQAAYRYNTDHGLSNSLIPLGVLGDTPIGLKHPSPFLPGNSPPHPLDETVFASASSTSYHNRLNPHINPPESLVNTNSNLSFVENSMDAFPTSCSGTQTPRYKRMYIPVYPATSESLQMLVLRYLTTMGEFQEFLSYVFEHNSLQLCFNYLDKLDKHDTCLAFEGLKYLASLMCHKKFALEFIAHGGVERIIKVPRPSTAANGVAITLFSMAYSEEAMERICSMPKEILKQLVQFVMWMINRAHDSGKCHAILFCSMGFQFKAILDEFDAQDGLRQLYNVISILKILNPTLNGDENPNQLNEELECTSRQLVRHVCCTLKRYMESHFFFKYHNFMRQQWPNSSEYSQNVTKVTKSNLDQMNEQIRNMQEHTSIRAHWTPVDQLLKLGGITMLLKVIALSNQWNSSGRGETLRSSLDLLSICSVVPRVFQAFCDRMELPDDLATSGMYSVLAACTGDILTDAEVQKSALSLLCNLVCAPITRKDTLMKTYGSTRKKQYIRHSEDILERIWEAVCSNNGIISLISLIQIKQPITDADCIRGMACRALAGLARSERVRQIIGKLPLFTSEQLQALMRDPILQEKRTEHVIFQKHALELMERVSGKSKHITSAFDTSLSNIHKANVVAQTKIQYNEQQLYQLIHEHLEAKGLTQTALMLAKEANLQLPSTSTAAMKNFHQSPLDYKGMSHPQFSKNRLRLRMQDVYSSINGMQMSTTTSNTNQNTNNEPEICNGICAAEEYSNITPIKLVKKSDKASSSSTNNTSLQSSLNVNALCNSPSAGTSSSYQRSIQKQITNFDNTMQEEDSPGPQNSAGITLSTIVTEYLTNQHALCNNPMSTCPQFDLFTPHKCPDPVKYRLQDANMNLSSRIFRAQAGFDTTSYNRRFVHSNFAHWRTIRSTDYDDVQFTCCDFASKTNHLFVGTQRGEAKVYNINDGNEIFSSVCHNYPIENLIVSKMGDLILTSCAWRHPTVMLWRNTHQTFESKMRFDEESYCEFSNLVQDKILGTRNDTCVIYDINTGLKTSTLKPTIGNQYIGNRATFNPTDELILSDGVLWDVRSGKQIHKFDKLNQALSGIFHPNGLEIISNTEVWDLRTFHLLQTVPVLDQSYIRFSPMRVMYAITQDSQPSEFDDANRYETSFKVLDAHDYSSIATIDVKRSIYDMSVVGNGSLLALIENQPTYETKTETSVKIYAVGMKKNEQDEEDDEDRDTNEEGSDIFLEAPADIAGRRRRRRNRREQRNNDNDEDDDDDDDNGSNGDNAEDNNDNDNDDDDDADGSWIDVDSSSDDDDDVDMDLESSDSDIDFINVRFRLP